MTTLVLATALTAATGGSLPAAAVAFAVVPVGFMTVAWLFVNPWDEPLGGSPPTMVLEPRLPSPQGPAGNAFLNPEQAQHEA